METGSPAKSPLCLHMQERKLTTQSLEFMRSPAELKLSKVETDIFQERLKYMTPRQVDLNFEDLIEKFKEHKKIYDEKVAAERKEEEKR